MKKGERVAAISSITILLLTVAEALIGSLSGSIILIVDALHNAADLTASFASWFGLRISQKQPDVKFPYGYYKAENLATLFVSAFILYAAYELILEGYSTLLTVSEFTMPLEALCISLISGVTSYLLAKYMKKTGEEVNSQSLAANAKERLTHVYSSAVIFVGILLTFYRIPYVEGTITLFFSLIILKIGIFTAKDSIFALMDVSPSRDMEDRAEEIIDSIAGVEEHENLKLRKSGPFVFGEVNVKIRKNVDVKRAHEIAGNMEKKIKEKIDSIDSLSIHIEPYVTEEQKVAIPIKQENGLYSEISDKFGRADNFFFVTVDINKGKVKSMYVKDNPYKEDLVQAGFKAVNFVVKEKIDILITKSMGGISFHTLRDHLVDIYYSRGRTAKIAVNKFIEKKLELLIEPTKEAKMSIVEKREIV